MNACTGGLLGRLFGHKFMKQKGGCVYFSTCCFRCGKESMMTVTIR
jgi:hypothetical protein